MFKKLKDQLHQVATLKDASERAKEGPKTTGHCANYSSIACLRCTKCWDISSAKKP